MPYNLSGDIMKRRFKARKKKHFGFWGWLVLIVFSLFVNISMLDNGSISYVLNDVKDNINFFNFDKEKLLLSLGLNYRKSNASTGELGSGEDDMPAFNETGVTKPQIYIYNTHQTEEYTDGNIYEAAQLLKDKLEKKGVDVLLESTDISDALKSRGLSYNDSYKITRELMEKNMSDEMALYIDLHRDSADKDASTFVDEEKAYAKIMFVIGAKHETYKENYQVSSDLNKLLKNINNGLSSGIYVRESSSYNQDLATNAILIELGGPDNTMEEVSNSVDVLADVIANYVLE